MPLVTPSAKGAIAEGWRGGQNGDEEGKRRGRRRMRREDEWEEGEEGELPRGSNQYHLRVWVGRGEPRHFLFPLPLVLPDPFPSPLTVLSKPSVINMRKKMMAKNVDAGMLAIASAYVMKRRLGPGTEGEGGALTSPPSYRRLGLG